MTYLAIERVRSQSNWPWTEFRRISTIRRKPNLLSNRRLLSVSADKGVRYRPDDGGRQLPSSETITRYWKVEPDDLVFNPMWAMEGGVAVSSLAGAVSTAYRVYKLDSTHHPRFVHYFARSWAARSQYHLLTRGVTTFDRSITREDFEGMPFPTPEIREQRAIADFLDAETARIDALITKKRRLISRLEERFWAYVSSQVKEEPAPFAPLRRFIGKITDGPFGSALTSSHYSDSGVRIVRLGNIGRGTFRDKDRAFIPISRLAELTRHRVKTGDLLIAGLGDANNHVGRACVAPDLGPAIVKADCYCAQVIPDRALADYLAFFLSSPTGAYSVALAARGTTRSRINLDIAKEILVPLVPLKAQRRIIEEVTRLRATQTNASNKLEQQIALLQERRQALITAAVTGQIEVPGAAA